LWTSGDAPQHETSGTASEILQETSVHAGWLVFGEVAEFVTRDLLDQLQFNIVNHWSHVSVSPLCYTSIPWRLASSSRIRFICAARTLRSVLCASTSSRQAMRRAASAATGKAGDPAEAGGSSGDRSCVKTVGASSGESRCSRTSELIGGASVDERFGFDGSA